MGKDSSEIIYVAFWDLGQILKICDCPGDSRTVGTYAIGANLARKISRTLAFSNN